MMRTVFDILKKPGYRPQAEDTSIEADVLEFSLLRSRTPIQRYKMAIALMKRARQLSLQSLKQRFPHLTETAFARKIARAWLQENCPVDFVPGNNQTMWIQDPLEIAFLLHDLFESIQVDYFITGGAAAILYGEPRTTRDLDVVIAIQPDRLDEAIACLERSGFYVAGIEDVKTGHLNVLQVIHTDTIARADLMLSENTPFDLMQLERRQAISIEEGSILYYASPKDVVLSKLQWRQQSQSEKQWRDILGILKVQLELLERDYLQDWATRLGVISELRIGSLEAGEQL
jgi:hypothetical protein